MLTAVTGVTGFVGQSLVRRLEASGQPVRKGTRQTQATTLPKGLDSTALDFSDESSLRSFCLGVSCVVHLAGPDAEACTNSSITVSDYLRDTLALFEAAASEGVAKFIYVSSAHVYGVSDKQVFNELSDCRPLSPYGASRLEVENALIELASARETQLVIVRLSNAFGWNENQSSSSWRLFVNEAVLTGLRSGIIEVRGNPSSCRDFISIDDASLAIESLIHSSPVVNQASIWNISSGKSLSLREVAERVAVAIQRETGVRASVVSLGAASVQKSCLKVSSEKAVNAGIFAPSPIDEALNEFVKIANKRLRVGRHEV